MYCYNVNTTERKQLSKEDQTLTCRHFRSNFISNKYFRSLQQKVNRNDKRRKIKYDPAIM